MDMAPMTGGCHYAWDCDGYTKDCSNCVAVANFLEGKPLKNHKQKVDFVKKVSLVTLSASDHLTKQLKQSTIFKNSRVVELILGIDFQVFKPIKNLELRKKFGIPLSKRVMFIGATDLDQERKGVQYIVEALNKFKEKWPELTESLFLMVAGKVSMEGILGSLEIDGKHIGFLNGDAKLAEAYQLADFFVSASIKDTGPMMINESIMSGTPVISFKMGVAENLVVSGQTGYLAELKNSGDLATGIYELMRLSDVELDQIKNNCRKLALEKASVEVQIKTFLKEIGCEV